MTTAGLRQAVGISPVLLRAIDLEVMFSPRFAHKAVLPLCSLSVQEKNLLFALGISFQVLE